MTSSSNTKEGWLWEGSVGWILQFIWSIGETYALALGVGHEVNSYTVSSLLDMQP